MSVNEALWRDPCARAWMAQTRASALLSGLALACAMIVVLPARACMQDDMHAEDRSNSREATRSVRELAELPDTPAADVLVKMIDALNSNDPDIIRAFVSRHYAQFWFDGGNTVDSLTTSMQQRAESIGGGLTIVGHVSEGPRLIGAKVRSGSGAHYSVSINTTDDDPRRIGMLMIQPTGSDQMRGPAASEREFIERLDRYMADLVQHDQFSGVVLVTKAGKTMYHRAAGDASKSYDVANTLDTRFSLGSMNKMFTAVAIAQLVDRGELAYTDTVGKHLPSYPNAAVRERVTLHHLLTHTSGMGGDVFSEESVDSRGLFDRSVNDRLSNFASEPMIFEPGSRMQFGHDGTYWGVSTEMHHFPALDITVVVLSNYDGAARSVAAKIDELLP